MLEKTEKKELRFLFLIILLGFFLRLAGSMLFPIWAGPDEPAHLVYIQHIAENKALPNVALTREVHDSLYYESIYQPPLYHTLLAPAYMIAAGQSQYFIVHFLRLFSVLFGTASIIVTYLIAKKLSLNKTVRIASAAFIALLPTHIIVSSVINNGPLVWLLCLAGIYFIIDVIETRRYTAMVLSGLFLTMAVLTKFTALSIALSFAIAALLFIRSGKGNFLKRIAVCAVPLAILPAFFRNLALSGSWMPPLFTKPLALSWSWLSYYLTHLFPGIWLQEYGTAAIPDYRIYFFAFYAIVSLAALVGFVSLFLSNHWDARKKLLVVSILVLPVLLNFAGVTYINTLGLYPDGRLLFDTIGLAAIMFVLGQYGFLKLFGQQGKTKAFILLVLLTMLFLDIVVLLNHNTVLPAVPWALS